MKIVVVIPTYNEAENIGRMADILQQEFLKRPGHEFHLLVVEGNSPDGTANVVREKMKNYPNVHLLMEKKKAGLGAAYVYGFKEAMSFIQNNPVDIFMVWKYDRAHRNLKETLIFVDKLKDIGTDYISVHQNIDTRSPQGRLFFQMVCSINEFEKEVIRERCREGRVAKICKKENPGGRIPVGYDKNWQIVEDKAEIVKDIFNAYLRLESLNKLKDYCRENSYNERLNISLGKMTLSKILKNRAYLGEFTYDGAVEQHQVLWKGHHGGIIAGSIFGKVQKRLERNRRK